MRKSTAIRPSDFSYNTGALRCPGCDGTGVVSLDVQFLPDVNIPCPDCRGSRYARAAYEVKLTNKAGRSISLPELMDMDVELRHRLLRGDENRPSEAERSASSSAWAI